MPNGVPVATVAVNAAKNAGILAAQIIGSSNATMQEKMSQYKSSLEKAVLAKDKKLIKIGYKGYKK